MKHLSCQTHGIFGRWIRIPEPFLNGARSIVLARRNLHLQPFAVLLPHQIYVDDLPRLMSGAPELWALPVGVEGRWFQVAGPEPGACIPAADGPGREPELMIDPPNLSKSDPTKLRVMHGWLVYEVDECTCAGGTIESNGHHEPGCGFEPWVLVDDTRLTSREHDLVAALQFATSVPTTEEEWARAARNNPVVMATIARYTAIRDAR